MIHSVLIDRFDPSTPHDARLIAEAIDTGLSGTAPMVARYEAALQDSFDARHAIAVSSGFGALVVALSALGLRPGDEVLLTPTCPLCTAYALTFLRIQPVFCDIRPDDFTIDLAHAARRLSPRTRALIDIPMWGYPSAADEVASFARRHGLHFVLDIALAHAARLNGRFLWSHADIATFSTHASKNLVTGEGGAVLTNDRQLASRARAFCRVHDDRLEAPRLNFALCGLQAALGVARLGRLAGDIAARLSLLDAITSALDNADLEPLPVIDGGIASGTKLIVRERSGDNRALLRHQMRMGIPSDIATYECKPLYRYPAFAEYTAPCPNAEAMLGSITTIPLHPDLDPDAKRRIIEMLNTYRRPKTGDLS